MANQDHFRKLLIRSALVTSSTIATLVGAQTLMLLDSEEFIEAPTQVSASITNMPDTATSTNTPTLIPTETKQPAISIQHATPNIVILQQAQQENQQSQTNTITPSNNNRVIQPPNPVQIAPPAPVIVQQPAAPIIQAAAPVVQHQSSPSSSHSGSSK